MPSDHWDYSGVPELTWRFNDTPSHYDLVMLDPEGVHVGGYMKGPIGDDYISHNYTCDEFLAMVPASLGGLSEEIAVAVRDTLLKHRR